MVAILVEIMLPSLHRLLYLAYHFNRSLPHTRASDCFFVIHQINGQETLKKYMFNFWTNRYMKYLTQNLIVTRSSCSKPS